MNSANWTFVGNGSTSSVILKHGVTSGNLIIYCNMKILLIDYDVFEKANYKFFIDEEFCQIKVWKKKGKFNYQFDVLDDVDTPLNQKRKERKNKLYDNTVLKALAAFGIVAVILLIGYATRYHQAQQRKRITSGTIIVKDHLFNGKQYNAAYTFEYGKKSMMRHLKLEELNDGTIVLENGLPVQTGDEYLVSHYNAKPQKNEMLFGKLLEDQEEQLQGRVINRMLFTNPSLTPEYCECLMTGNALNSIELFANLYFRNYTAAENPKHNSDTYSILMNHPDMIQKDKDCYYTFVEQCD